MEVKSFFCPSCGGALKYDFDGKSKNCFCMHCGAQIIIDDGVIRTEHVERTYDYAKIEEEKSKQIAEIEKTKRDNKEQGNEKIALIATSIMIIGIVFVIIFVTIFDCLCR